MTTSDCIISCAWTGRLVADSEELEGIIEYRKAKNHKGHAIPFEQAFIEIEEVSK